MTNIKYFNGYIQVSLNSNQQKEKKKVEAELGRKLTGKEIEEKFPYEEREVVNEKDKFFVIKIASKVGDKWNYSPQLIVRANKDVGLMAILVKNQLPARVVTNRVDVNNKIYYNVLMIGDNSNLEKLDDIYREGKKFYDTKEGKWKN